MTNSDLVLANVLRGRNINTKVIPTVCNLQRMLRNLREHNWNKNKTLGKTKL